MLGFFRREEDPPLESRAEYLLNLRAELEEFRLKISAAKKSLPAAAHVKVGCIAAILRNVLVRADQFPPTSEEMMIVSRTIRDYLPTSINSYLALPAGYTTLVPAGAARSPKDELVAQLELLENELEKVADVLHRSDLQALANQGRFLEGRFHSSALDLP